MCGKNSCSFTSCGPNKKCCCTTTSLDVLKNAVSERNCCSTKQAHITVYNYDPIELTSGNLPTSSIPFSNWDMDTIQGIVPPGTSGLTERQVKVMQSGVYLYNYLV